MTIAHEHTTPSVRTVLTQNIRPSSHVLPPEDAAQETRPAMSVMSVRPPSVAWYFAYLPTHKVRSFSLTPKKISRFIL